MEYKVLHSSFTVSNMERSIAFYRDVLGLELTAVVDGGEVASRVVGHPGAKLTLAFFRNSGHEIELIEYETHKGDQKACRRNDVGGAHLAFLVDDCEAEHALGQVGYVHRAALSLATPRDLPGELGHDDLRRDTFGQAVARPRWVLAR
jgi:catechol-2,3-dioxygenase